MVFFQFLAMKDDSHDGYGNQFDTSTSFSAETTNVSTFKYGVQFNATTSSSANDDINESRNVNGVVGPQRFDSYASTSAEDAIGGSYNGFGAIYPVQCAENNAIDGVGGIHLQKWWLWFIMTHWIRMAAQRLSI